LPVSPESLMW